MERGWPSAAATSAGRGLMSRRKRTITMLSIQEHAPFAISEARLYLRSGSLVAARISVEAEMGFTSLDSLAQVRLQIKIQHQ